MARYIDVGKVLLELQKFSLDTSNSYGVGYSDCLTAVEDVLNEAPTADVTKVRHAKWEINSDGYYPYCSNCMTEPKNGVMSKHCPECGADMRGEIKDGK